MTTAKPRLTVAFDFDGTLTNGDTLLPFLRRAVGGRRVLRGLARAQLARGCGGESGRERAKRTLLISTLAGLPNPQLAELGAEYADHLRETELRPDIAARLLAHKEEGHLVVIVSASLGYYLDPLAAHLGVDHVICCRPTVDSSGRSTGILRERNLRGQAKIDQLAQLLGSNPVLAYAYGNDPVADGPLLNIADNPVLVGRSAVLPRLGTN